MSNIVTRQPALTAGAFQAIVNVIVIFGVDWTGDQVSALNIAFTAALAVLVRSQVTPVEST